MAVGCARQFVVHDFSCRFHRSCSLAKFIAKVQRVPSSTIGISTVPSWKDPGRLATGRGKLAKWGSQRDWSNHFVRLRSTILTLSLGKGFYALSRVVICARFVTPRQTFVRRCQYGNGNAAAGYFQCTDL